MSSRHVLFVGLCLLGLAVPANAQCRSRSYNHYSHSYGGSYYSSFSPTYYAPVKKEVYHEAKKEVYVDPVVVRFQAVVPLLEYKVADLPSYGSVYTPPPANGQAAGLKAAPLNGGAGQQAPASSQMEQLLAQNGQILTALKNLENKVDVIDKRVTAIERTRAPYQAQPAPPPKNGGIEEGPPPKVEPLPPAKQPQVPAGANTKLVALNKAKCAMCHSAATAADHGGEFVLSKDDGTIMALSDSALVSMQRQITKGKMPKVAVKRAVEHNVTALTKEEADLWFEEIDRQISREAKK